ncbi:chemotaxis protein CheB [Chromobacterium sp. CV08]|uniref:chemotaxis protein CheB n=1 Tax=Chromobacterium sp. CV08 TaxID=3133274 RepID=UPI003DA94C8D
MSVTVQSRGSQCRVAVLGRLESADDKDALLALLDADAGQPLELSFYDADVLGPELLSAIAARLDAGGKLKINAYHALLAHSLMRLNLPVRQVSAPRAQQPARPAPRALALAGSAQSLERILHIVERLPLSEMAVFVAQHVQENQVNLLDQLLKSRTDYGVEMPQHMTPVRPGTIYVAPPGHHMRVGHGHVYLTRDRQIQFARPSIDVLFQSLAGEYGDGALAVLLCGFGHDGVDGCAALRAAGSRVIVEDGDECAPARVMPDAARNARHYDFIMKLPAIASTVAAAAAGADAKPDGELLELFLEALSCHYGYDFRHYQRDSLKRRIHNLMNQFGLRDFADFQRAVLTDVALFERLSAELPVGVTSFFRHPAQLRLLRDEILPYLASFPLIKLWSAGCSSGEEAYSLAIVLDELGLLDRSHLFATDLNPYLLALGASGLYPAGALASNRENYLASGGPRLFDAHLAGGGRFLRLADHLRQRILFYRHSLTDEGIFNEFQLIVCRNVLIYFDAELQREVLRRFARSLHADGFLVLGPQDGLHRQALDAGFLPYQSGSHIYRVGRSANR